MQEEPRRVKIDDLPKVNGSRIAYMLYATDSRSVCNALITASNLRQLGTPPHIPIVALVSTSVEESVVEHLRKASIIVELVRPWRPKTSLLGLESSIWEESLTKLHIFEERGLDKVVYLDADMYIHRNLDHLFNHDVSNGVLWAPTAYYSSQQPFFGSTLMIFAPSNAQLAKMLDRLKRPPHEKYFDMDVLNDIWTTVNYLPPHYVVLNSDLNSQKLFGFSNTTERIANTYATHFSAKADGTYGKPWEMSRAAKLRTRAWASPLFYKLFQLYWTAQDKNCPWIEG
ncbi:unnamed protein product [Aphanomyces euteiches]